MAYTCAPFVPHACIYGVPHGLYLCMLYHPCLYLWRPLMAYTCASFMSHACTYGGPSWSVSVHPSCPVHVLMEAPHGLYLCTLHAPCLYLWRPLMAYTCAPFMPHASTYGGSSWPIPVQPSCPVLMVAFVAFACAPFMPCACAGGVLHGLCLCTLHAMCMC